MGLYTNAIVKQMVEESGEGVCMIVFDNDFKILIGYPGSQCKSVSELKYQTVDGTDLIGISSISSLSADKKKGVSYTTWHATELIHYITIMDPGFEDYRPDPQLTTGH